MKPQIWDPRFPRIPIIGQSFGSASKKPLRNIAMENGPFIDTRFDFHWYVCSFEGFKKACTKSPYLPWYMRHCGSGGNLRSNTKNAWLYGENQVTRQFHRNIVCSQQEVFWFPGFPEWYLYSWHFIEGEGKEEDKHKKKITKSLWLATIWSDMMNFQSRPFPRDFGGEQKDY